jgi:iron complex outermembrane recepter protein
MNFRKSLLCSAIVVVCASAGGEAIAQQAPAPTTAATGDTGVILVTARKRAENIQRVPAAVTAKSGVQLQQQNIFQPGGLSKVVPSLTTASASASTPSGVLFIIRGQAAADILLTLGQAVGFYEDSVNIPQPEGSNGAFYDINRVEVLNGPQGTLYGRNTTGGAINVITNNPDYNGYHGYVTAEAGNYNDWKLGGAVNVPIVDDKLAIRLAYQHWSREGFGQSAITGERLGDPHDDDVARLSVKFDPNPQFSVVGKLEYDHANLTDELYQTTNFTLPGQFFNPAAPGTICNNAVPVPTATMPTSYFCPGVGDHVPADQGNTPGGLFNAATELLDEQGIFPAPGPTYAGELAAAEATLTKEVNNRNLLKNFDGQNVFDHTSAWHGVIDANWRINDNVTLRSITGVHQFTDLRTFALTGLPGEYEDVGLGVGGITPSSATLFGQALGGAAPLKPDQESLSFTQEFDLSGKALDNRLNWLGGVYYSDAQGQEQQVSGIYQASNFLAQGLVGFIYGSPKITNSSFAIFSQDDLKLNDMFSITLGGRFTQENLSQTAENAFLFGGGTYVCLGGPNLLMPEPNQGACAAQQSLQSQGFSYLVSFNAQLTPDILLYAKTARGFKGGALQQRALNFAPAKPEIAVDYELGLKSSWFDHRLVADFDIYDTEYADKQQTEIITIGGVPSTPILNAKSSRIQGFEWQVTADPFRGTFLEGLTAYTTGDYIDGKYLDFPNAVSPIGQVPFNASGVSFGLPPWTLDVGGRYQHDVGPGLFGIQADWSWTAATPLTALNNYPGELPALQKQWYGAVGLLNGRVDYTLPQTGLTIAFFANNLLNKHWAIPSTPFIGVGADYGYISQTQDPQMYGVQLRWKFGQE